MRNDCKMPLMSKGTIVNFIVLAALLVVVMPAALDAFRLNLLGKYLSYAFVALGLVLCWGYGGILSLGHGIFFGLGGYCMAMFLKLEASTPEATKIQSTPGIPDFMDWNQLTALPWFWEPFKSFPLTMILVFAVPVGFAFIFGMAMFKRRVSGVYFSIITQAISCIMTILIVGQQGYTGGANGITDLRTCLGFDIRGAGAKVILYYMCVFLLMAAVFVTYLVSRSKFGRMLVAIRDDEERVRFSGYDVANYKVFVLCFSAALAAIGGAMFTLQVGFMSPSFVGIVASIEMVVFCAVGGRMSIFGAIYGTLIVSYAKTAISENFPELWSLLIGAIFIGCVLVFPKGLAGVYTDHVLPRISGLDARLKNAFRSAREQHDAQIEALKDVPADKVLLGVPPQFRSGSGDEADVFAEDGRSLS
jgi:urea transport system permease protein